MDVLFSITKKVKTYSPQPIVLSSLALIFAYTAAMMFSAKDVSAAGVVVFNVSLCAFFTFATCRSGKKAVGVGCAMLLGDMLLYAFCGAHFSLIFGIVFALTTSIITSKMSYLNALILSFFIVGFCAFLISFFYQNLYVIQKNLAAFLGSKPVLFGAVNNALKLFFGNAVESLIYHKSFSSTTVINDKIITGVLDAFKASPNAPKPAVSQYLTGKYFASVFIPVGVFFALYKRLDGELLFAFITSIFLSLLFGDERLFYLTLLITSPVLYVGSLVLVAVGYVVSSLLDFGIGFANDSSVFELIKYINKPITLFFTAAVMILLSYFITRLIIERFSLLVIDRFPKNVRDIVEALGGKRNILKISDEDIIVANPNLIDVLRLDCDIRENRVMLVPEELEIISKYCK